MLHESYWSEREPPGKGQQYPAAGECSAWRVRRTRVQIQNLLISTRSASRYCTACGTCYATGECTLLDDFSDLFDRIMNADGIILGAPNYIDSVPAPMKAFFDRMADAIHCQMLTGKFGCSVCTAGGAGEAEVVGYMNKVLYHAWRNRRGRSGRRDRQGSGSTRESRNGSHRVWERRWPVPSGANSPIPNRTRFTGRNGSTSASWSSTTRTGSPTSTDWYVQMGWMK